MYALLSKIAIRSWIPEDSYCSSHLPTCGNVSIICYRAQDRSDYAVQNY